MRHGRRMMLAAAGSVFLVAGLAAAAQGQTLNVTVTYTGSGEVSATHAIYLAVYDTPDIGAEAVPIAAGVATANGETVSFESLTASTVYLSALYDATGGWDGQSAVPSGTPASTYRAGAVSATAIEVGTGPASDVDFSFDDAFRMP